MTLPPHETPGRGRRSGPLAGWNLHARLAGLLAFGVLMFAAVFVLVQQSQNRQVELLFNERVEETSRVLDRLLELRAHGPAVHDDDYSRWTEMVNFVRTHDPEWGRVNLTESIQTFDVDVAWIIDSHDRLVYTANPLKIPALDRTPVPPAVLAPVLHANPVYHFFAFVPRAGLIEVWSSSIRTSDDFSRTGPCYGYYVVGRRWSPERLASLAQLASGRVAILAPRDADREPHAAPSGVVSLRKPLTGIDGQPVATLGFETSYPVAASVRRALNSVLVVLVGGVVVTLGLFWIGLTHWVRRPVTAITDALEASDPARLGDATHADDEMGNLARLVEHFFAQQKELERAREAAEQAVTAKSQFLANISHELRTPMHGILSYARFGLNDSGTSTRDELHDYFRNIDDCGTSLLGLLNDLLDLSKFEAGRMPLAISDVSLPDVVSDAADEFKSLYAEMGVELQVELDETVPELPADRTRLLQVFRNLLSNAVKFSPNGSHVRISLASDEACARVCVDDEGKGIPPDELEHIFDKFVQAKGTHPRTGGTGLGLAICREIVQRHGGRIWAENRTEGGARMVFEIPLTGAGAHDGDLHEGTDAPKRSAA